MTLKVPIIAESERGENGFGSTGGTGVHNVVPESERGSL